MLNELRTMDDEEVQTIWNALKTYIPDYGWNSAFDQNITWSDWLEAVYSEMCRRDLAR